MSEPKRPADVARDVRPARPSNPGTETSRAADSAPMVSGSFSSLPMRFGRYRVDKLLGKGSMGAVYLAFDEQLDRFVALKVARVSSTGSANLIKRMETEAKSAANLDHPLICKVYDFGEIEGIRFIALQYVEGEDLKSYLKRVGRRREPAEAIRLILQMTRALAAAHDKGIIHRDLKPENVMLNNEGEPVIMDFGLAKRITASTDANLTQGMILGTAAYMSPEQAIGKSEGIDLRSDLYAIGVMLFEMLAGEWPFTGTAIEVMGAKCILEPPAPLSLNPELHPQLAAVCKKMIAKRKQDRFHSCSEIITALEAIDLNANVAMEIPQGSNDALPSVSSLKSQSDAQPVTRRKPLPIEKKRPASDPKLSPKPVAKPHRLEMIRKSFLNSVTEELRFALFTGAAALLVGLTACFLLFRPKLPWVDKSVENVAVGESTDPTSAASTTNFRRRDPQIESVMQRLDSVKRVYESETSSQRKKVNAMFENQIAESKQREDTNQVEKLEEQYREYQLNGKFPKWIDIAEVHTSLRLQQVLRDAYARTESELDGLNETELKAEISRDLQNLNEHPASLLAFIHQAQFRGGRVLGLRRIALMSDGSIENEVGTWSLANEMLIFHWPHPNGVWVDTAQISADGLSYSGSQQGGGVIVTGERVE